MTFCQSCAMPLTEDQAMYGTNGDGTKSEKYCAYCYQNGNFTNDTTMDGMIDLCVPHMMEGNPGITQEAAKAAMKGFFPTLERWR